MKYNRTVQITLTYTIGADTKKGISAMMNEIRETIPYSFEGGGDDADGYGYTEIALSVTPRKDWKIRDLA